MNYVSTRDSKNVVSSSFAIAHGISKEGGLFVPESLPKLNENDFNNLKNLSYVDRAKFIFKLFLTDFTDEEIDKCVKGAYIGSFDDDKPAPMSKLGDNVNILELWHGPTCAFKDLALQILPFLLTTSAGKVSGGNKSVILVATSGDTGKAALEGFCDVPNTEIIVFYPENGVSEMQKLQMASQKGENVHVCAIKGNFDDAQTAVKKIFTDNDFKKKLSENKMEFSSANSINWGRLCPQIVYYVSAYVDMLSTGADLSNGINICVPTGNFGNILAAYYAKLMGVPIKKLICASNKNRVLTDFINTGVYNRNREFYLTSSPSMDILISSNLERLLYDLSGCDDGYVASLLSDLSKKGEYEINGEMKEKISNLFYGGSCDDNETAATINETFEKYGYLIDTHTAVAVNVYNKYKDETGDNLPVIIASTASPYKFANSVLAALGEDVSDDKFKTLDKLSDITKTDIPKPINDLKTATVRFTDVYSKEDMYNAVNKSLGIN
ncbi:MAG: threonine synthase [Clostridia bacterium]|nr:threonine synthase [Clostridia bacterium]